MVFSYKRLKKCRIPAFAGVTALCLFAAMPVQAEVFQWGSPGNYVSMTFPDTWRRISDQQPNDVMTVIAPGGDNATCRIRVNEDRRALIYPREFAAAVQHVNYSQKFWDGYAGQLGASRVNSMTDNAGLGQAFASWADISFVTPDGRQMRAMTYAGVYNDEAYVFECSSTADSYLRWQSAFLDVLKSVDMRPQYTQTVNGNYRPFQKDAKWKIHSVYDKDMYLYP